MEIDTIFTLPFRVLFLVTGFIVWNVLSNGEWKRRKRRMGGCPVSSLQGDLQGAFREKREMSAAFQRQESDLRSYYEQKIKKLEREISYLRSRLYK